MSDFLNDLEKRLAANLEDAAQHLENKIKARLDTAGRSEPNNAPGKESGALQDSITHVVKDGTAYIGSAEPSALPLEFGTHNMAARPFLRPTLTQEAEAIARLLAK